MKGLSYLIVAILLMLYHTGIRAQVQFRASVDKNQILIGEQIRLELEAYVPLGAEVQFLYPDSIPHFEFLNTPDSDTIESIDGKKYAKTFTITSFDSGRWEIPSLVLRVNGEEYYSDTLGIDVAYSATDVNADYRDIKNIEVILHPFAPYIPWVIGLVTVLALFAAIFYLRKRKPAKAPLINSFQAITAYEQALQALKQLKQKQYPEKGMIREYYTELNDIIRVFVFKKLSISALERTNEELILQLGSNSIPRETYLQLAQALRMSDFVKFAKYKPDMDENHRNFVIISDAIHSLNNHN